MENIVGSPVEGDNFFGREADVARLRGVLAHDDILLLGPRRIGKTSIARAVMALVRGEGWRAIEINVASCLDERGFLDKLQTTLSPELSSFAEKTLGAIGDAFTTLGKRIKAVKISLPGAASLGAELGDGNGDAEDWTKVAGDILRLIAQADEPWLIYIDELPIMLFNIIRSDPQNGVSRVRRFLDWFRNDVRALPNARKVRWLVSGSVGLDTLVQQHGMADTINSMKHETLKPFKDEIAVAMLDKLATRYAITWSAQDAITLIAAVQWPQPYYLQGAFHHLRSFLDSSPMASPAALIEQAIDELAQPGTDNDFHHWEGRLTLQLTAADAGHALTLLNLVARDPAGVRAETLFAALQGRLPNAHEEEAKRIFINLRDILQRDAYWWPDESSGARRYRFRLEPLRRWWLRRDTL